MKESYGIISCKALFFVSSIFNGCITFSVDDENSYYSSTFFGEVPFSSIKMDRSLMTAITSSDIHAKIEEK